MPATRGNKRRTDAVDVEATTEEEVPPKRSRTSETEEDTKDPNEAGTQPNKPQKGEVEETEADHIENDQHADCGTPEPKQDCGTPEANPKTDETAELTSEGVSLAQATNAPAENEERTSAVQDDPPLNENGGDNENATDPASETVAVAPPVPTTGNSGSVEKTDNAGSVNSMGATATMAASALGLSSSTDAPLQGVGVAPSATVAVADPETIIEEQAELPVIYIGKVLGKGGDMVRDLQTRSSCRIDVDQNVPHGSARIITYRGTRSAVKFAKYLVQILCSEQGTDANLPLGNAEQKVLVIPASSIGKVIGRGGEMVRSLQYRSQARIQIDHSGAGLDPSSRNVTITGTRETVVKAEEMIMFIVANPLMEASAAIGMLVQDKARGGVWGSGPPYPALPNQGQGMSGYASVPAASQGERMGGYAYDQGPVGTQHAQAPHNTGFMGAPAAAGPAEMDVFSAAKTYMGRIIGSKGITINDVQTRSGCDIQINQDVPAGQDCQITIRGSRQGIEMAKQIIREIIELGPNHPYAGGGQQGGYGGQQGGYNQQQAYGYHGPQAGYGIQQYAPQQHYGGYQYYQPAQQYGGYGHVGVPPMRAPMTSAWKSATSADGQVYYYNEQSGETQWEKPAGML